MALKQFDVEEVIPQLNIDEKIALLSGIMTPPGSPWLVTSLIDGTGVDFWHTAPIPRLNIPSIRMSDGPNGVRGTKFFDGVPAACFPCGTALGATWDSELMEAAGRSMGQESRAKGAAAILGPTGTLSPYILQCFMGNKRTSLSFLKNLNLYKSV